MPYPKNLPDHQARYENQADEPRNARAEDGVVQQKVQLTPPGEPTHVYQRKHDQPDYRTVGVRGADVPAFNPDAPPVTLREDEMNINPFGTERADESSPAQPTAPDGLTRLTEPADAGPVEVEGDTATQKGSRSRSGK
jgi:hypothetical protein